MKKRTKNKIKKKAGALTHLIKTGVPVVFNVSFKILVVMLLMNISANIAFMTQILYSWRVGM